MVDVNEALQGAWRAAPAPSASGPGPALVLGAGGGLGAALLTQVLSAGHTRVGAWVHRSMASTHRGLLSVRPDTLQAPTPGDAARDADFIFTNVTSTQDVEEVLERRIVFVARFGQGNVSCLRPPPNR